MMHVVTTICQATILPYMQACGDHDLMVYAQGGTSNSRAHEGARDQDRHDPGRRLSAQ